MFQHRTHNCAELRTRHVDQEVRLIGWLQTIRNLGGISFILIRDEHGVTQIRIDKPSILDKIIKIPRETILSCDGIVRTRSKKNFNIKLSTGKIEIELRSYKIISRCENDILPSDKIDRDGSQNETKMELRCMSLRTQELHSNIVFRSKFISSIRRVLIRQGFNELPIVPENHDIHTIEDFLALSHVNIQKIFDSSQSLKPNRRQLLMIAGFERVFQIRPRLHDWEGNPHTQRGMTHQIDLEMGFITQNDIFDMVEKIIREVFKDISLDLSLSPFAKISASASLFNYATTEPDLRSSLKIRDVSAFFQNKNSKGFSKGIVKVLIVPNMENRSNSFFNRLGEQIKLSGFGRFNWAEVDDSKLLIGPLSKFYSETENRQLINVCNAKPGNCLLFITNSQDGLVYKALMFMQTQLMDRSNFIGKNHNGFCWITDFPLYEINNETNKLIFASNPFSMPQARYKAFNSKNLQAINAYQFDLVCNGCKIGTGAIRTSDAELMYQVFRGADFDRTTISKHLQHVLKALNYGAPPHGGITIDIDALITLIRGNSKVSDFIPFPYQDKELLKQSVTREIPMKHDLSSDRNFNLSSFLKGESAISTSLLTSQIQKKQLQELKETAVLIRTKRSLLDATQLVHKQLAPLIGLLPDFSMKLEDVDYILDLLPKRRAKVLNSSKEEIFQFLWSIIGNDHVKVWLRNSAMRQDVKHLADIGVLTDYKHLRLIHPDTLQNFNFLLKHYLEDIKQSSVDDFAKIMRTIVSNMSNDFSTTLTTLRYIYESTGSLSILNKEKAMLFDAIKARFCTPILFSIYKRFYPDKEKLYRLEIALLNLHSYIYPNHPINSKQVSLALQESLGDLLNSDVEYFNNSENILSEVIYYLFKPINMDIYTIAYHLKNVRDASSDLKALGLKFSGNYWNKNEECYEFRFPGVASAEEILQLYSSKNVASFFTKASAGICTLNNLELFERKDHFHINLVDGKSHVIVGNVQAYVFTNNGRKALLLRAINPSETFITKQNAPFIMRSILLAAIEFAKQSNMKDVYLSESLGIWHAQSCRPEIQAVLELLYEALPATQLDLPFFLYKYQGTSIYIRTAFNIWSKV